MANSYEVPAEMREFAERSVGQARKAVEGLFGAIHKATGAMDTSSTPALSNARDMSTKAVSFAETNVNSVFDLADKLVRAKDIQEVLSIQSEYVKSQMDVIQQQTRELGTAIQAATGSKTPSV